MVHIGEMDDVHIVGWPGCDRLDTARRGVVGLDGGACG
jgi:hypothetical protein